MAERGRTRRRAVTVDLGTVRARLTAAGEADRAAWEQIRAVLLDAVGESTFEIWLAPLQLLTDGYAVDAVGAADQAKIRPAEDVALPSESSPLLVAGRAEGAGAALRDWIEAKSNWGSCFECALRPNGDRDDPRARTALHVAPRSGGSQTV